MSRIGDDIRMPRGQIIAIARYCSVERVSNRIRDRAMALFLRADAIGPWLPHSRETAENAGVDLTTLVQTGLNLSTEVCRRLLERSANAEAGIGERVQLGQYGAGSTPTPGRLS